MSMGIKNFLLEWHGLTIKIPESATRSGEQKLHLGGGGLGRTYWSIGVGDLKKISKEVPTGLMRKRVANPG